MPETEERIHRTEGASLKIKSKRGTGTNDRDEVEITTHGEDLDELAADADQARELVADVITAQRSVQPDDDDQ